MDEKFRLKIQSVLDRLDPQYRSEFEAKLNSVLNAGVDSEADLLEMLADQGANPETRISIGWIVLYFDKSAGISSLRSILENTEDALDVRTTAAQVLSSPNVKDTVTVFSKLLIGDPDAEIRRLAAYALGLAGDRSISVIENLIDRFRQVSEDPRVRAEIANSLAFLHDAKQAVPYLREGLKDQSAEVRFWSAYALGHLGDISVVPELEEVSSDESFIEGWWSVGKEARDAIQFIRERQERNQEEE